MNPCTPRYRIGPLDRLAIDGEHYRPVSSDHHGHVLCKESSLEHHTRYTHEAFAGLHATGALIREPNHFSYSCAQHQQRARSTLLSQISPKRQDDFLHRLHTVNCFLELERAGAASRSPAGLAKAAVLIADQLQQAELEADLVEAASRDSDVEIAAEAQKLTRLKGSRKGLSRHDSIREPIGKQDKRKPRSPVSARTLATWINRLEKSGGDPSGLLDGYGNCGSKPTLDLLVEGMIASVIGEEFLTEKRPSIRHCHRMLANAMHKANAERSLAGIPLLGSVIA